MTARVRPFAPGDESALAAVYAECTAEADWLPTDAKGKADFAADTKGERMLVAVTGDDVPVGFVSVWEPEAFIHHIYVRRDFRARGIGALLLESLDGILPKPWRLKCLEANDRALAFYRRLGWHEVSRAMGEAGPYILMQSRGAYSMDAWDSNLKRRNKWSV